MSAAKKKKFGQQIGTKEILSLVALLVGLLGSYHAAIGYFSTKKECDKGKQELKHDIIVLDQQGQIDRLEIMIDQKQDKIQRINDKIRQIGPKSTLIDQKQEEERKLKKYEDKLRILEQKGG